MGLSAEYSAILWENVVKSYAEKGITIKGFRDYTQIARNVIRKTLITENVRDWRVWIRLYNVGIRIPKEWLSERLAIRVDEFLNGEHPKRGNAPCGLTMEHPCWSGWSQNKCYWTQEKIEKEFNLETNSWAIVPPEENENLCKWRP